MVQVEMDDLYDNAIYSAIEHILFAYLAKERNKGLRREFRTQEGERNLLQEDCQRLKAHVFEVENTMKEMLEFMDELQVDLDEANAAKANLEDRAKAIEDQVAKLHRQVQML